MAGKPRTVPAFGLSRIVTADSSVIGEGKVGRLSSDEFQHLKGLGYVREPTEEEIAAADEPADEKVEAAAFDPATPTIDAAAARTADKRG
jgi:hypothetical protein